MKLGSLFDGIAGDVFHMKTFSEETKKRMSESAKRRCTLEWRKKQSQQKSAAIDAGEVARLYKAGHTQHEIAVIFKTTQKVIWRCMKNNGIKARTVAKRNQSGSANHMWKGDSATYEAFHSRVEKLRGTPKECNVCGTDDKDKFYDWANLMGNYSNPSDYERMCRSCHRIYDNKQKKVVMPYANQTPTNTWKPV